MSMVRTLLSTVALVSLLSCRTPATESETAGIAVGAAHSTGGTLVLVAGQAHVFKNKAWQYPFGNEKFSNDLQFYRGSKDFFFVNIYDQKGETNKTFGWRWWNLRNSEIRPLVVGSRMYRPYRFFDAGPLIFKYEHFKYTEIIFQDDSGRRVEHARPGRFLYNYTANGNYSYIDWPSIGEEESKLYSNLVAGKQMLLKMGDKLRNETVLAAAPAIMQPRFVAGGKSVCYFKPGQSLARTNEKTFLLECVGTGGTVRTYGALRSHVKGSRLPPVIWAFEDSPYVVTHRLTPSHPDFDMSGPIEILNSQNDEAPKRYNLGPGWMLVNQISARGAGLELEPFVVAINEQEKKIRVLNVPDLSLRLETSMPENLSKSSLQASYIPD